MFLDHVDSFGKFLKFFFLSKKHFYPCLKKKKKGGGQNTVFAAFSKKQFLVNFPC